MTAHKTVLGLIVAAMLSLALAPSALAGPAGDEYLPKVPQSGAQSASGSSAQQTGTTTLPGATNGSGSGSKSTNQPGGKKKDGSSQAVPASPGSGGSGGDGSSGSILLNPILLLMIAAVIAAAVGMTLRRRQVTSDGNEPEPKRDPGSPSAGTPRTPDGEIVAGPDQAA